MKRCDNCNDMALYDDVISNCPVCNAKLVDYIRIEQPSNRQNTIRPVQPISEMPDRPVNVQSPPEFETRSGIFYQYRGMVSEIQSQSRLHSRLKKIINSLFRGAPYQFGHTSHETVFRIDEFTDTRLNGRRRDFVFYGDVEGRFFVGDDVLIRARRKGDRYVVQHMYLNETNTQIRPTPQLPAVFVWIILLLLIGLCYALVTGLIAVIESGVIGAFFHRILPYVIIVVGLLLWIRYRYRRRG